jgi:hypothetical protein
MCNYGHLRPNATVQTSELVASLMEAWVVKLLSWQLFLPEKEDGSPLMCEINGN